ncbi:hypothetical protein [Cardinium endosymbiont of Dermatophagoides farinae]|uniref:hypothetical protein n=1 Tax=Cardinium endosymbiont of Dermatophagoides farinae TaxID=2597823 RepID=UPI001642B182|nr:hypothetical protein [Cardinium endosymbiont of Dermatophagoides farinae]
MKKLGLKVETEVILKKYEKESEYKNFQRTTRSDIKNERETREAEVSILKSEDNV